MTYFAEDHKRSQAAIGRKGRKNCREMGTITEIMNNVATSVFIIGPGNCAMLMQKMPSTASPKYWKSYSDH